MHPNFDIRERAREAMVEYGFEPVIPDAVLDEAAGLADSGPVDGRADLTGLLWSSIDNPDTRDFDQLEVVEKLDGGVFRLRVAIADVDCFVGRQTQTSDFAQDQTTSIYTGVATFPMLPEVLSTDRTSLVPGQDRRAVVAETLIDADGEILEVAIVEATVRNNAKLDYPSIGAWLLDRSLSPPTLFAELAGQVLEQDELATALKGIAVHRGALEFETLEPNPVMGDDRVVDLVLTQKNGARDLIEQFMIATNTAVSRFLQSHGLPQIERIVRTPERWSKIVDIARSFGFKLPIVPDPRPLQQFLNRRKREDPDTFPDLSLRIVKLLGPGEYAVIGPKDDRTGHFGLALHEYTHSTAPNRRYPDLVTQRLIKSALRGEPSPYTHKELESIAEHCTERGKQAGKVERLMRKVAAAALLSDHIDQTFDAIVTGASNKGVYARIKHPPAEGRVVRGERGLEVGDCIRVRLIGLNVERGWIDFATVR